MNAGSDIVQQLVDNKVLLLQVFYLLFLNSGCSRQLLQFLHYLIQPFDDLTGDNMCYEAQQSAEESNEGRQCPDMSR